MPTTRRQAREWAVQMLFELDASARTATGAEESLDLQSVFTEFWAFQLRLLNDASGNPVSEEELFFADDWEDRVADGPGRRFAEEIVRGVAENLPAIDQVIAEAGSNWDIGRMGGLERSTLRMGAYEILFCDDVPAAVAINEAIDITRYFGLRESARFVNGILDSIAHSAGGHARLGGRRRDAEDGETWSPGGSEPAP